MGKRHLFIIIICLITTNFAQELGTIKLETVPEGEGVNLIVRDPNKAILVVHSTITPMSYESNNVIIRVNNPDPGEYYLHLRPGTHIITFKSEGFLPLKKRFYIPKKEYKEINISGIRPEQPEEIGWGDMKVVTEPPGASIKLDGIDIKGSTPKLFQDQLARKHKLNLTLSNYYSPIDTSVSIVADSLSVFRFKFHPRPSNGSQGFGDLKLITEPPGATIKIDGINVRGKTPITFQDQKSARHRINFNLNEKYYQIDTTIYVAGGQLNRFKFYFERKKYGDLKLLSNPSGASIELDGIPVNGQTPITFKDQKAGEHTVRLTKGDLEVKTSIVLKGGQLNTFNINFADFFGDVRIGTELQGVNVKFDGEKLEDTTPVLVKQVKAGQHQVYLEANYKYMPLDTTIKVVGGRDNFFNFKLKKDTQHGDVRIETELNGASVKFDGQDLEQTTPVYLKRKKKGQHELNLEGSNQYEPLDTSILVRGGTVNKYRFKLKRKTGPIALYGYPAGANVNIDDRYYDLKANDILKLKFGDHRIRIDKKGYYEYDQGIQIDQRDTTLYKVNLDKKSGGLAVFYSMVFPGAGQRYYGSKGKGWVITLLTAGLGGGLYYLNDEFRTKYDLYNQYLDQYEAATTSDEINTARELKDQTYTELQELKQYTYGAAGALGLIWLYNVIDAGLAFNSLKDDTIIMSPYAIQFSIKF